MVGVAWDDSFSIIYCSKKKQNHTINNYASLWLIILGADTVQQNIQEDDEILYHLETFEDHQSYIPQLQIISTLYVFEGEEETRD